MITSSQCSVDKAIDSSSASRYRFPVRHTGVLLLVCRIVCLSVLPCLELTVVRPQKSGSPQCHLPTQLKRRFCFNNTWCIERIRSAVRLCATYRPNWHSRRRNSSWWSTMSNNAVRSSRQSADTWPLSVLCSKQQVVEDFGYGRLRAVILPV